MQDLNYLIGERDARKWAEEFNKVLMANEGSMLDEGWLLGWFANAIETGYMLGSQHEQRRDFMEKLHEIVYQAAGAATVPFMQANPEMVFPDQDVVDGIEAVLKDHGIPPRAREERVNDNDEDSVLQRTSSS